MAGNTLKTCPDICPANTVAAPPKEYLKAGMSRGPENPHASPYVPGMIKPPEPKVYPPGAPPRYLPQPTDSTSGDILGMGPIGPWAAGHLDWTPQAGTTGVRPVVDKYSITRYSTGEWRNHNLFMLTPRATDKAKHADATIKRDIKIANENLDKKQDETNSNLGKRVKDLGYWKKQVEQTLRAMDDEIELLDQDRSKLKGACRILNLPEAISKECLELRTNRYEPDLVRDDAEQELVKEVAIVGEIRRVFENTLAKVEEQMANNRAAKSAIESDWNDKMVALKVDKQCLSFTPESSLLLYHPGVARWPENASNLEYWLHYCAESIKNCDEVRQKSENLRGDLMTAIVKGGQDLKTQGDRTNAALAESVSTTEELRDKLEETLKDNLKTIADIENLISYLKDELRKLGERTKLNMTRLHARNYDRPNVENCRDEAQYALMAEAKFIKETTESFNGRMREAEAIRSELMKYRGDLEKEIASKRKSLNIDQDRLARVRAHMPKPEEFAGG
ncbi:tektin-4-like [Amyelois transitella]|uniref:tektin-4-like n=1 Tax=Amyelois transitella TaxID=680683 RepID=UPI00298F6767|nr:tektin-4-like [Amyelois transitella]